MVCSGTKQGSNGQDYTVRSLVVAKFGSLAKIVVIQDSKLVKAHKWITLSIETQEGLRLIDKMAGLPREDKKRNIDLFLVGKKIW